MATTGHSRRLVVAVLLVVLAQGAAAQDFDSRTMAFIHDKVVGLPAEQQAKPGIAEAIDALRAESLVTSHRVPTSDVDVVSSYARALMLGTRGNQFLPEIAEVRNGSLRQDRAATGEAIAKLYAKAGRSKPSDDALNSMVDAVFDTSTPEPEETQRRRISKPGRTIEITDAHRAGLYILDITTAAPNGEPQRTVIVSERRSQPDNFGGLEQRAVPVAVCSISQSQAASRRRGLNGDWRDHKGHTWQVTGDGEQIALTELRRDGPPLTYSGTYKLGRIDATHPISAATDMGPELPLWVRQALVGRTSFAVRLDDCGESILTGTWESRHVTYSTNLRRISRIHNPYDLQLRLTRNDLRTARGGRMPEDGP